MAMTTKPGAPAPVSTSAKPTRGAVGGGLLDPKMLWQSLPDAFKKLDPRVQVKNPVMFVVEVGALLTTITAIFFATPGFTAFNWTITVWLWLTVVFANLAEAVAEGRGKAQAETLRKTKRETVTENKAAHLCAATSGKIAARMPPTATPAVVKVEITLGSFGRTLKAIKIEATPAHVDGSFMRAAIYQQLDSFRFSWS